MTCPPIYKRNERSEMPGVDEDMYPTVDATVVAEFASGLKSTGFVSWGKDDAKSVMEAC